MYNTSFVEEREVRDIVYAVELWGIHLREGVEGNLADLVAWQRLDSKRRGGLCGSAYLSTCSHNYLAYVILLLYNPACEISILVVGNPDPLLLIELCLGCSSTCSLRTLGRSWSRHGETPRARESREQRKAQGKLEEDGGAAGSSRADASWYPRLGSFDNHNAGARPLWPQCASG